MSWVIIFCSFLGLFCLMVGGLAGMAWEQHCAERDCEAEAEVEADESLEPLPAADRFAGIREAGRRAWAIQQARSEKLIDQAGNASEVESLDDLTDEEWFARVVIGGVDEIIAWAHAASDPGDRQ